MTTTPATERRDFGTIYKQKRSPYLWVRYRVDGKEYRESSESTNPRVAEKLLARRQAELGLGVFVAPDVKRTTYDDLAQIVRDDYKTNQRKSGETLETLLKRLSAAFKGARATSITADRIARYVAERLDQGAARATVRNERNALHRAFKLAHRLGKVASVPAFPSISADPPRSGFLEDADLPRLLKALSDDLRPLVQFVALTGWRIGEARGLTWDAVDFGAGVVTLAVGSTKSGAGRHFPFAALPDLQTLVTTQRERTTALEHARGQIIPHVFHRNGQPIKDFYDAWKGATTRVGLAGLLVHDLRRSACRRFIRAGIPERVAMSLSGHKTRSIFDRYNIVSERDLAENVAKLAATPASPAKTLPFKRASGGKA